MSLLPRQFHVGIVFVTETPTATHVFWDTETEVLRTAIAVDSNTATNIDGERKVAGQRLEERLVQHRSWSRHSFTFCIGQNTGIENRAAIGIRFQSLHLGFHSLDALLVLSLHLVHFRLYRIDAVLIRALSKKRVSGQ